MKKCIELLTESDISFINVETPTIILKAALGAKAPQWPYGKAMMPNYVAHKLKVFASMGAVHIGFVPLVPLFLTNEAYQQAIAYGRDSIQVHECLSEYYRAIAGQCIRKRCWVFGPAELNQGLAAVCWGYGYSTYVHQRCEEDLSFLITLEYGKTEQGTFIPGTVLLSENRVLNLS